MNISFIFKFSITGEDTLVGLATEAARNALEMANVDPNDIDLILMCTSTPEDLFGSAPQVAFFCFVILLMNGFCGFFLITPPFRG